MCATISIKKFLQEKAVEATTQKKKKGGGKKWVYIGATISNL
jgi:hypothetical protein